MWWQFNLCGGGVEGREGRRGRMVSGNDAHGEAGPEYWTTPNPCAEPMCEAAENPSPVSSGVLVTVKSMIYSNKRYSVFGNMCKKTDGDNYEYKLRLHHNTKTSGVPVIY